MKVDFKRERERERVPADFRPTFGKGNISHSLQCNLCFKKQSVEAIKEEVPSKNFPIAYGVDKQIERL
jgi:hypothetical protein